MAVIRQNKCFAVMTAFEDSALKFRSGLNIFLKVNIYQKRGRVFALPRF